MSKHQVTRQPSRREALKSGLGTFAAGMAAMSLPDFCFAGQASEEENFHVTWKLRASFEKELDFCVPRDKLWDLTAERLWTVERWIG